MSTAHFFSGGRIFTGRRFHDALLIDDGRVVAVGPEAEVRRDRPNGAENHALRGDTIVPGLIDAHLHLAELVVHEEGVLLGRQDSIPQIVDRSRQWAQAHPVGPIVGRGWSMGDRPESEWPRCLDLDRIDPNRPVLLYHASGHALVTNSVALHQLGIHRRTADPPGGRIGRAANGEPDGRLFEAAMRPARTLAHEALVADPAGMRRVLARATAFGLTTVGTMNTGPDEVAAIRSLSAPGHLPVRIRAWVSLSLFAEMTAPEIAGARSADGRFAISGVKAFADGAFGTRTAWLTEPYADAPGTSGMEVDAAETMREAFGRARALGLSPAVHALGDRGLDRALELLRGPAGHPPSRPERVEHGGLVPPAILAKVDRVRPILVVQPIFVWTDGWLGDRLGPRRARWAYPFRTLLERGHVLAGSSDAPFDAFDPWIGLAAAIHRVGPDGRSANPIQDEELSPEMAVAMYTRGGATALGEPEVGELLPGRRADFVRIDAPSLEAAIPGGASAVRETWVDGVQIYRRNDASTDPKTV